MSLNDADLDLLHRGDDSCEYRKAVYRVVGKQRRQVNPDHAPAIECPCGKTLKIVYMYRCKFCDIWWCPKCAELHFSTSKH